MYCSGLETRPNINGHASEPATLWNAIALFTMSQAHPGGHYNYLVRRERTVKTNFLINISKVALQHVQKPANQSIVQYLQRH